MPSAFTEREWVLSALALISLGGFVWKALKPSARSPMRDLVFSDEPSSADAVLAAAKRKPGEWKAWLSGPDMFQPEITERRETRVKVEKTEVLAEKNTDHLRSVTQILEKQDSTLDAQKKFGSQVEKLTITLDHLAKVVERVSDKVDSHDTRLTDTQLEVGGIRSDFRAWQGKERRTAAQDRRRPDTESEK